MIIIPPVAPSSFTPSFATASFNAPRERFAMTPISALLALGARCTRAEILIYTALELHADKNTGHCNPGRETLAQITGLPENRVTKATTSLEKKGFIRKEQPDPFHVHYFLLPPPAVDTVDPRARFRPPLKARPVEPAAPVVPPAEPTQCRQRHEPVPPAAPLTDQWTDQKEKESATPEPAAPEPAPQAPLSQESLRTIKTPPPDGIPESWLTWAIPFRADLPAEQIKTSIENFLDRNRAKGLRLVDWEAELRIWLRRERAVKAPVQATQAPNTPSRYAHLDMPEKAVSAAVRASIEAGEQRRLDQLRAAGIDPQTGNRIVPPTVINTEQSVTPATPSYPPSNTQTLTRAQQLLVIELAAAGVPLAEAKARVAGEGRG